MHKKIEQIFLKCRFYNVETIINYKLKNKLNSAVLNFKKASRN